MRLTLLALVGAVCIACSFAQPLEGKAESNDLLNLADLGQEHVTGNARQVRQFGYGGWGGGGLGGYGGGGWGGGGWGRGGWGRGGWGRGGWGRGGWGGGRWVNDHEAFGR
ncbi:glycine-rich cell wall structural protein-like [Drosophila hydei]|uniref:Glycine-rich cell wall structural protein-like n=1 Tax=Drosophila hydei TaxID=7224 RepID=A0A6J1MJ46_DROHY|nr:glycine-rich cell wall structural protein-like [Drosophila hydei]